MEGIVNMAEDRRIPTVEELSELLTNIKQQHATLAACQQEQKAAYGREIDALNTVNRMQKELDRAITALRQAAPRDTDWYAKYVSKHKPADDC